MTAGLDESLGALKRFGSDLIDFEERLGSSLSELQQALDQVSPLWQDSMRREFDSQWSEFHQHIVDFRQRTGPNYVEWVQMKIHALEKYLGG